VRSRWLVIGVIVLVGWYVVVLTWAFHPLIDHVPTGVIDNKQTVQPVTCASPVSSASGAPSPLPTLLPGRAYETTPCIQAHRDARLAFLIDSVFTAIALSFLGWRLTDRAQRAVSPGDGQPSHDIAR